MIAYKAFNKDLTCTSGRGVFQYEEGKVYKEDNAKCATTGFHCTNDPLDTLTYYPAMDKSVYYTVDARGDINEDGVDSRISCTEIELMERLDIEDFVYHALLYMFQHPKRKSNEKYVKREKAKPESYRDKWFVIVRGKNPAAAGDKGCVLGLLKEKKDSEEIEEIAIYVVGEDGIKPDTYIDINGEEL